jgi:hypothetical protein
MSEAEGNDYSDLLHDAMCWRALRKLLDDAAIQIERPGADQLPICYEALDKLYQLVVADADRELDRVSAALSKEQLPQPLLEYRAGDAQKIADRRPKMLTLVKDALADEGRWAIFAVQRGYLAGELEWARGLDFFRDFAEPANVLAGEANRLGGVGGKKIKGENIVEWREQVRREEDSIAKMTYDRILNALVNEIDQPQTKANAVFILKNMVRGGLDIDPRRKNLTSA